VGVREGERKEEEEEDKKERKKERKLVGWLVGYHTLLPHNSSLDTMAEKGTWASSSSRI
jgi:hypothetical protein